jgi:hypothetical protein
MGRQKGASDAGQVRPSKFSVTQTVFRRQRNNPARGDRDIKAATGLDTEAFSPFHLLGALYPAAEKASRVPVSAPNAPREEPLWSVC